MSALSLLITLLCLGQVPADDVVVQKPASESADAARDVERAKSLLQQIQRTQGQGAEVEPSLKQFISERKAAWAKPK